MEGADNLIDALFGLRLQVEMQCQEVEGEKVKEKYEKAHKLVCNIRGTEVKGAEKVDHLFQGVLAGFEGSIELHSPVAGRNALWKKTTRIDRLPRYICVQFMRFFWKATPGSRDHAGISCKIMRKVKFPRNLDVYEFCSKRLKDILRVPREKHAMELLAEAERKAKAEREQNELEKKGKKRKKRAKKEEDGTTAQDEKVSSSDTAAPMDVVSSKEEEDEDGQAVQWMSILAKQQVSVFRKICEITNFALVTHRTELFGWTYCYVRENLSLLTHSTHSCEHNRYEERVKMIGSTLMMIW